MARRRTCTAAKLLALLPEAPGAQHLDGSFVPYMKANKVRARPPGGVVCSIKCGLVHRGKRLPSRVEAGPFYLLIK